MANQWPHLKRSRKDTEEIQINGLTRKGKEETYDGVVTEETGGKYPTEWFMTVGEWDDDEGKRQNKLKRGRRRREGNEHWMPQQGQEREQS